MPTTTVPAPDFIAAHRLGLKDHELATHFRISVSTVKRYRQQLQLGSNCPHNTLGKQAEQQLTIQLRLQGFQVSGPPGHNAPFDLSVNGWRVEVKVGQQRPSGSVQFRLPTRRGSNRNAYWYEKSYTRDADFMALVVMTGAHPGPTYVVPTSAWRATITVQPNSPFCPYQAYRDHWSQLRLNPASAA